MSTFYQLKVADVIQETSQAVVVAFQIPKDLTSIFNYKAGQYVTLRFNLNGKEERRSYSICSSPNESVLKIGVKRVKKGLVSNHINDTITKGSVIEVMPPEGRFQIINNKINHILYAAGSGITPILSIIKTLLLTSKDTNVYLLYGNTAKDSIMFFEELFQLQNQFSNRLFVVHTLSKANKGLRGLFKSSKGDGFKKGRIDANAIKKFITSHTATDSAYYVCGPGTMIENTKSTLMDLGVAEANIMIESFGEGLTKTEKPSTLKSAKLIAHLDGETVELNITKGKSILKTLLDEGYDAPYSCQGGVCSTCICKVKQGHVAMQINIALTDKEVEDGFALSCQSFPTTDMVEVVFE